MLQGTPRVCTYEFLCFNCGLVFTLCADNTVFLQCAYVIAAELQLQVEAGIKLRKVKC